MAAHDVSNSDATHGTVGSSQETIESRSEQDSVGSRWTEELCWDLLDCYNTSEPAKRGYMRRLRTLWVEQHPELASYTEQNLRDQVAALKRRGFAPRPAPPDPGLGERDETTTEEPPAESVGAMRTMFLNHLNDARVGERKRTVHFKQPINANALKQMNTIITAYLPERCDLWDLDCVVYAAAKTLTPEKKTNNYVAKMTKRLEQIDIKCKMWRKKASQTETLLQYLRERKPFTKNVREIAKAIKQRHHTLNGNVLLLLKEQAIDKLRSLKAIRTKIASQIKRYQQNTRFAISPSKFMENKHEQKKTPKMEEVEAYWRKLYETSADFNPNANAIKLFRSACTRLIAENQTVAAVTAADIKQALAGKPNFAAPGPDAINTYWWKKLTATHERLAVIFNQYLDQPSHIPPWIAEGRTILIFKKGDPEKPQNYRPITCLNAIYKTFTSILQTAILEKIENIWNEIYEQRGTKKGIAGVRENLLIDRSVCQDAGYYKRNLSMAWIDYRKAFDCTSHGLLIHLLEAMKVPKKLLNTVKKLTEIWRTRVVSRIRGKEKASSFITYRRGVYQGDSLSPLLFCVSLLPLSLQLRQHQGYMAGSPNQRTSKITHLFYVDDLKIYAQSEKDIKLMLETVKQYSTDISMEFGIEKCAVYNIKRGRGMVDGEDVELVDGTAIRHLQIGESYTYLGVPQNAVHEAAELKRTMMENYTIILKRIWNSELNGKNKCAATNSLAVPTISHTFGAIRWNREELQNLDRATRKVMTKSRSLHPNASVQRLYLCRGIGGRGLQSLEGLHDRAVVTTACRIQTSKDPLLRLVASHEINDKGAFLYKAAIRAAEDLGISMRLGRRPKGDFIALEPEKQKQILKQKNAEKLQQQHSSKAMHGLYSKNIAEQALSVPLTYAFLRSPGLRSETEGYITAVQDGVYHSRAYRKRVMGMRLNDLTCTACRKTEETTFHLLAACSTYARTRYIERHDAALKVLYYHLRHKYGIDETAKLPYTDEAIPPSVTNNKCKILWNFPFSTTAEITANRPDMAVLDLEKKYMYVVEMSCPADVNVVAKEEEKRTKYTPLLFSLKRTYPEYKIIFLPVIIGVMGGIHQSLVDSLATIGCLSREDARRLATGMQKAVILGSLRLLRAHDAGQPPP